MRKALPLVVAGAVAVALGLVGSAALANSFGGPTPTEAVKQVTKDGSQPFTDEAGNRMLPTFYGSK